MAFKRARYTIERLDSEGEDVVSDDLKEQVRSVASGACHSDRDGMSHSAAVLGREPLLLRCSIVLRE